MQLEYKVTFETKQFGFKHNRQANEYIMSLLNKVLLNCNYEGEVERITDLRMKSPHTLETYYDLENEVDLRQ